jgi:hypothetical protein
LISVFLAISSQSVAHGENAAVRAALPDPLDAGAVLDVGDRTPPLSRAIA